jgi:methylated-DNA-[protein]-cysteine S-methyltransferase
MKHADMHHAEATIWYDELPSPIGNLLMVADAQGLREVLFASGKNHRPADPHWVRDAEKLAFARAQLQEYFDGKRTTFDLPLHPIGTAFQLNVWKALATIPYGLTVSYAAIAQQIHRPKAVRAVGAANGRNPIPIVVPCHRVIGSNGSLTGFGGGLPTKQFLLALEKQVAGSDLFAASGPARSRDGFT